MAAFGGPLPGIGGPPAGPPPAGPPPLVGPAIAGPPAGIIYAPPAMPGPPALTGHLAPVRQGLAQLKQGLIQQSQNWEGFKDTLHQAIHAILTAAIARGNGTVRIPAGDIPIIVAEIQAAIAQVGNANLTNAAERDRVLRNLTNYQNHLALAGGWTPKPRPTKRKPKRRKSIKWHA